MKKMRFTIKQKNMRLRAGLTLIEIVVVVAILAVLSGLIIVAINPQDNLSDANAVRTQQELSTIQQVLQQIFVNNNGNAPTEISGAGLTGFSEIRSAAGGYNICSLLVPTYLDELPVNATGSFTSCSNYALGYELSYTANPEQFQLRDPLSGVSLPVVNF